MSRKISAPHLHLICRETKLLQRSFAKKGNLIVGVGDDNEDNDDDMMMMMNCFCGMVDRQKTFSLISNWVHTVAIAAIALVECLCAEYAANAFIRLE